VNLAKWSLKGSQIEKKIENCSLKITNLEKFSEGCDFKKYLGKFGQN